MPRSVSKNLPWRRIAAAVLLGCAAGAAMADVSVSKVRDLDFRGEGGGCNGDLVELLPGQMYNTCRNGGGHSHGSVIRLEPSGNTTVLKSFQTARDGPVSPNAGLTPGRNGLLYGSTADGGLTNNGTLFKMNAAGKLTVLHHFTGGAGGAAPYARLLQAADGRFYGTTWVAGEHGHGVVFRLSPSGKYKVIHQFRGGANGGAHPAAELIQLADGHLYGTTEEGGVYDKGVVFRLTLQGALTVLHSFGGGDDGWWPQAGLVDGGDGFLYGTSDYQSQQVRGTVFRIRPGGEDFTVLHRFTGVDGSSPWAPLRRAPDGLLYGSTQGGGLDAGSVYRVTPVSGAVEVVHVGYDVLGAKGGLLWASDGALYGTTYGTNWDGGPSALFKVSGF
jgi:uncharacterized repeat protein (TIGR03803 family)